MDHAVALVQAYLQLNGYFTATEYPVVESNGNSFRTMTDIDIIAFRFPSTSDTRANELFRSRGLEVEVTDPGLSVPHDRIDMIIGEVKEGRVNINSGAVNPSVLRAVIARFGCSVDDTERMVRGLVDRGEVTTPSGYQVRLIAFGAMPPGTEVPPCRIMSLGHVLKFLQEYVRKNWDLLRHCQLKDPAFGFLMTMEKARRGGAGRRGEHGVELVPAKSAAESHSGARKTLTVPQVVAAPFEVARPAAPPNRSRRRAKTRR